MDVEALTCSNSGAPLDVPSGIKFATCSHCGSRLAITRTGSAAFTEVLDQINEHTDRISTDVETIRLQNDLERLDREWERDPEQFSSGPGRRKLTNIITGITTGIVVLLLWFGPAPFSWTASGGLGLCSFGVLAVLALGWSLSRLVGQQQHKEAENAYQASRNEMLRRLDERS